MTSMTQLSLFPEEPDQTIAKELDEIAWSYSRRSAFERCLRQYYYEYFGSKKRAAIHDPDKEQIQFLSSLQSRHLRAGAIVHMVIRVALQKAQKGEYWSVDRLTSWAVSILRKDRDYSRISPDGNWRPDSQFPPNLLMEYHYHVVDVEAIYDDIETRIVNALTTFATSPVLEDFRSHGRQPGALLEKRFTLTTLGCKVDGQIDLAYQSNEGINIVDWKIGEEDGVGEDSLQMAVYALWAMEEFNYSPHQIRVYKAFLGSDLVTEFNIDAEKLEAAKARIIQDAERLASVQNYGEQGVVNAFTPRYQSLICNSCPFQRLCYGT